MGMLFRRAVVYRVVDMIGPNNVRGSLRDNHVFGPVASIPFSIDPHGRVSVVFGGAQQVVILHGVDFGKGFIRCVAVAELDTSIALKVLHAVEIVNSYH